MGLRSVERSVLRGEHTNAFLALREGLRGLFLDPAVEIVELPERSVPVFHCCLEVRVELVCNLVESHKGTAVLALPVVLHHLPGRVSRAHVVHVGQTVLLFVLVVPASK